MKQLLIAAGASSLFLAIGLPVSAQPMVYTTTPLQTNGDRFFESTNMNWSLRGPNFFATFGGPNIGVPRFGGYNPNAGISSGWAFNSGNFSGTFGFNFSQGYERFSTTTAPSLMTTNGQTGQFFSGVRRPFVYSLVPVVPPGGAFFSAPSPEFHQQDRLSGTLADRVLRGELVLPNSRRNAEAEMSIEELQEKQFGRSPEAARVNAAYAWFQSAPQSGQSPASENDSDRLPAEPVTTHVENLLSNQSDEVAIPTEVVAASAAVVKSSSNRIAEVYLQKGLDAVAKKDFAKARFLFRLASEKASGGLKKTIQKHLAKLGNE
jgi:hypothetical protein